MMRATVTTAVFALALYGCSDEHRSDRKWGAFNYERAQVNSEDAWARERAAGSIKYYCCHDGNEHHPVSREACPLLTRIIETDRHQKVLESALMGWDAACYSNVPITALFVAMDHHSHARVRELIIRLLGNMEPSPEIVRRLVGELGYDGEAYPYTDVRHTAAVALAKLGEPDLGPVVAALDSSNPMVRRGARHALGYALDTPLDLPQALVALDRAAADKEGSIPRDPTWIGAMPDALAFAGANDWEFSQWVANRYRRVANESIPVLVERLVNDARNGYSDTLQAIRLLSRRKAFCNSEAATAALEQFRADPRPQVAAAATQGIAFRAEHCLK